MLTELSDSIKKVKKLKNSKEVGQTIQNLKSKYDEGGFKDRISKN